MSAIDSMYKPMVIVLLDDYLSFKVPPLVAIVINVRAVIARKCVIIYAFSGRIAGC